MRLYEEREKELLYKKLYCGEESAGAVKKRMRKISGGLGFPREAEAAILND